MHALARYILSMSSVCPRTLWIHQTLASRCHWSVPSALRKTRARFSPRLLMGPPAWDVGGEGWRGVMGNRFWAPREGFHYWPVNLWRGAVAEVRWRWHQKVQKNSQLLHSLGQDPKVPQVPSEIFPTPPWTVRASCLCSNPRGRCLPGFVYSPRKRPSAG